MSDSGDSPHPAGHAADPSDTLTVVVMAKRPVPGRVKTRLTPPLTPEQAAGAHDAMLRCVIARLTRLVPGRKALALDVDTDEAARAAAGGLPGVPLDGWDVIPQGGGDLGERLDHVWRALGSGPVAFFGVDSPDVPADLLAPLPDVLRHADAAAGPTEDGGYWTLLARRHAPALLRGIDWGTATVYDQTRLVAASAELAWAELPRWFDVDDADDLAALRRRLGDPSGDRPDPDLVTLDRRLAAVLHPDTTRPVMPESDPSPRPGGNATAPAVGEPDLAALAESIILIVDDNEQNVELLQAYLEALPCGVEVAYDGQAALERVEDVDRPKPDLILLDVMMPRLSGFEVCRKLKDDPATRAIPVMMVTALNELGDIERGVESGTDDFVTKPVNRLELLTRCKSLLRVRQLKRELERTEAHLREIEGRRGESG